MFAAFRMRGHWITASICNLRIGRGACFCDRARDKYLHRWCCSPNTPRALSCAGRLVTPGTVTTMIWHVPGGRWWWTTRSRARGHAKKTRCSRFSSSSMAAKSGETARQYPRGTSCCSSGARLSSFCHLKTPDSPETEPLTPSGKNSVIITARIELWAPIFLGERKYDSS